MDNVARYRIHAVKYENGVGVGVVKYASLQDPLYKKVTAENGSDAIYIASLFLQNHGDTVFSMQDGYRHAFKHLHTVENADVPLNVKLPKLINRDAFKSKVATVCFGRQVSTRGVTQFTDEKELALDALKRGNTITEVLFNDR
jgi:hypothetical protein